MRTWLSKNIGGTYGVAGKVISNLPRRLRRNIAIAFMAKSLTSNITEAEEILEELDVPKSFLYDHVSDSLEWDMNKNIVDNHCSLKETSNRISKILSNMPSTLVYGTERVMVSDLSAVTSILRDKK